MAPKAKAETDPNPSSLYSRQGSRRRRISSEKKKRGSRFPVAPCDTHRHKHRHTTDVVQSLYAVRETQAIIDSFSLRSVCGTHLPISHLTHSMNPARTASRRASMPWHSTTLGSSRPIQISILRVGAPSLHRRGVDPLLTCWFCGKAHMKHRLHTHTHTHTFDHHDSAHFSDTFLFTTWRDMLAARVGGWNVDFNPELRGNAKINAQMVPAIKAHGQVTQSGHQDSAAAPDYYGAPASPQHETSLYDDPSGNLSVDSIIEAQVQTMMKCVK